MERGGPDDQGAWFSTGGVGSRGISASSPGWISPSGYSQKGRVLLDEALIEEDAGNTTQVVLLQRTQVPLRQAELLRDLCHRPALPFPRAPKNFTNGGHIEE